MTTALITGASGQDGTILSRVLTREGVNVVGLVKPDTDFAHLVRYAPEIRIIESDLEDSTSLTQIAVDSSPDFIYNLGGFTAPGDSWDHQEEVRRINVGAVEALLNAMRKLPKQARMFQASSALVFEGVDRSPQTEAMETRPKSPYAKSKADAMALVREARENDGLFAVSGVFYNHESPLRGPNFVTRKISMAVAKIAAGQQQVLELGDIEVARDWGWAPDYVNAAKLMLEADQPNDYLLATGISHRLSYFITKAFQAAGITDWADLVVSTSDNARQADTNMLVGESKAAYTQLGWRHTVDFDSMAQRMVEYDMALLKDPELLWLDF
jgi:GDPmannose 4,6-dehydratase